MREFDFVRNRYQMPGKSTVPEYTGTFTVPGYESFTGTLKVPGGMIPTLAQQCKKGKAGPVCKLLGQ